MSTPLLHTTLMHAMTRQFVAAHDMLLSTLRACPQPLWHSRLWPVKDGPADGSAFWYLAFHALFWTDLYLAGTTDGFGVPAPFGLSEFESDFVVPPRAHTLAELEGYLAHTRARSIATFASLDEAGACAPSRFGWLKCSFLEVQLYNLRHLQEHTAQLNTHLGREAAIESLWIRVGTP